MRIAIDRSAFTAAMKWVEQGLAKNPALPVLAAVPLRVADGKLTMSGFDYETSAQITMDVTTDDPGNAEALVSGRVLSQLAGALPRDMVYLEMDDSSEKVGLTCGSSTWTLTKIGVTADYPSLPPLPPALGTVNGADFADAISRAAFATGDPSGAVVVLAGVWLAVDGDRLTVFSTDRFRIPQCTIPWEPARPGIQAQVSVPARFIEAAAKQMADEPKLSLAISDGDSVRGGVGLDAGWRHIVGGRYSVDYPRHFLKVADDIRPSTYAEVNTEALIEAVKRIAMILPPKGVPIGLHISGGEVTVSADGDTAASGREAVTAEVDGEDVDTLVNPHFLIDALSAMHSTETRIGYSTKRQFVLTDPAASPDDPTTYRHVVMAIRPTN